MKTPFLVSFSLLIAAVGAIGAFAEEATPTAAVGYEVEITTIIAESNVVRAGVPFRYIVRLSWEGRLEGVRVNVPEDPLVENLEIVKLSQRNRIVGGMEPTAEVDFVYTLQPHEEGEARVEPVTVTYTLPGQTEEASLMTSGDDFDVRSAPINWGRVLIYVAIAIAVLAIISAMVWAGVRWTGRRSEEPPEEAPTMTLEQEALKEIARCEQMTSRGEYAQTLGDLAAALKTYLAGCLEQEELKTKSTSQVLRALGDAQMDASISTPLKEILTVCDQVRFSGSKPEAKLVVQLIEKARDFVAQMGDSPARVKSGPADKEKT